MDKAEIIAALRDDASKPLNSDGDVMSSDSLLIEAADALSAPAKPSAPEWPTPDHRLDVQCAKCGNEITAYLPCPTSSDLRTRVIYYQEQADHCPYCEIWTPRL